MVFKGLLDRHVIIQSISTACLTDTSWMFACEEVQKPIADDGPLAKVQEFRDRLIQYYDVERLAVVHQWYPDKGVLIVKVIQS